MTLEEIYAQEAAWEDRLKLIRENALDVDPHIAEYAGERVQRDTQVGNRKDKVLKDGSTSAVNKIPIQFQKRIVRNAASFLFGEPVTLQASEPSVDLQPLLDAWEDYRIDSLLLQACESAKAYTQSALLFHFDEEGKFKVVLLKPTQGKLIPIWGTFDELDAFVYETVIQRGDEEVTRTYIFDEVNVTILEEGDNGVQEISNVSHGFEKIPIVYFEEEQVEYEDVKPLIDRYENRFSRFADTNDYFSSPFFKAVGKVDNVPTKDDTGSIFMMDVIETDSGKILTSDLDVVGWDSAPEATKAELEITKGLIYDLSDTPDIGFDNVKGIGNVTGIALKLMFLQAQIKAKFSIPVYKIAVKRVLSVFLTALTRVEGYEVGSLLEQRIDVIFNDILPSNDAEIVNMLSEATMNKPVMSQRTAVGLNPLVNNPDDEMEQIQDEESSGLGATQNPFTGQV